MSEQELDRGLNRYRVSRGEQVVEIQAFDRKEAEEIARDMFDGMHVQIRLLYGYKYCELCDCKPCGCDW